MGEKNVLSIFQNLLITKSLFYSLSEPFGLSNNAEEHTQILVLNTLYFLCLRFSIKVIRYNMTQYKVIPKDERISVNAHEQDAYIVMSERAVSFLVSIVGLMIMKVQ
jgi:hypothetical protein